MKKDIHPKYGKCIVKCVCGNTFETRSIIPAINVDICGVCHPVYTGKKKIVDSTGRVERYEKMIGQKKGTTRSKKEKRVARSKKKIEAKSIIKDAGKESK